jgi:hypothetical protein
MSPSTIPLEVIEIPKPCPADWSQMRGDERVRFCSHCSLHVYNLSAMSRMEAEQLLEQTEGRMCVRLYKRLDGTVITQDCGGGWRLAAKRLGRWASAATALVIAAALTPLTFTRWVGASPTPKSTPMECTKEPTPKAFVGRPVMLMGDFAVAKMGEPAPAPPVMGKPAAPAPPATQPATQPAPATAE